MHNRLQVRPAWLRIAYSSLLADLYDIVPAFHLLHLYSICHRYDSLRLLMLYVLPKRYFQTTLHLTCELNYFTVNIIECLCYLKFVLMTLFWQLPELWLYTRRSLDFEFLRVPEILLSRIRLASFHDLSFLRAKGKWHCSVQMNEWARKKQRVALQHIRNGSRLPKWGIDNIPFSHTASRMCIEKLHITERKFLRQCNNATIQ